MAAARAGLMACSHAVLSRAAAGRVAPCCNQLRLRPLGPSCPLLRLRRGASAMRPQRAVDVVVRAASTSAVSQMEVAINQVADGGEVRVRFAPSPTGNLHVGGARTALFNWLFARRVGGKFILRVEDTDTARSTRESEEMMIRDLKWLGLTWDEGPDVGGPHGPYRQSERTAIYDEVVRKLVASGHAYPCFCTEAELDAMKKAAEAAELPPKYTGKWAHATQEEVDAMKAQGVPFSYRFRVPVGGRVEIDDMIRGRVGWDTEAVGDFVIMRSSGMPVYNFCVVVDDALMRVTHVLRAEEHLPNTLRQALIYDALGNPRPQFGHMSLILAPDRSKLSKRHGATSVGEFANQGYLPEAMVNYLSLLGWNDGTKKEIFAVDELVEAFSVDRIIKSAAVFDNTKLSWMNGQHLRAYPKETAATLLGKRWAAAGLVAEPSSAFVSAASALVQNSLEVLNAAEAELRRLLGYPLEVTVATPEAAPELGPGLDAMGRRLLAAYDSGELQTAVTGGTFKDWLKATGKALGVKGHALYMPVRICLTGSMKGPDVGDLLTVLALAAGAVTEAGVVVPLDDRIAKLRTYLASRPPASAA